MQTPFSHSSRSSFGGKRRSASVSSTRAARHSQSASHAPQTSISFLQIGRLRFAKLLTAKTRSSAVICADDKMAAPRPIQNSASVVSGSK